MPHANLLNHSQWRFLDATRTPSQGMNLFYHDHHHQKPFLNMSHQFLNDDCYCFNYCLNGGGTLTAPDGTQETIQAGTAFCIPPCTTTPWSFTFDPQHLHIECSVVIGKQLIEGLAACLIIDTKPFIRHLPVTEQLMTPFFTALTTVQHKERSGADIFTLIIPWLRLLSTHPTTTQSSKEKKLARIRARLLEHISESPCFDSIALEFGMSYQSLRRQFQEKHHCSPGQWLAEQKITRACELLATHHKVKDIAEMLGYSDAFHFSRRFKQALGQSPSAYLASIQSALTPLTNR